MIRTPPVKEIQKIKENTHTGELRPLYIPWHLRASRLEQMVNLNKSI